MAALKLILSPTSGQTILDQTPGLGHLVDVPAVKPAYQEALGLKANEGGLWELPPLPYAYESLEPYIDTQTMRLHHDMHHNAYVTKFNAAITKLKDAGLPTWKEDPYKIIQKFEDVPADVRKTIRDNGGGYVNHQLFWLNMAPPSDAGQPSAPLLNAIQSSFGSVDALKEKFSTEATNVFGSGWAWLTLDQNKHLKIIATANQDTPVMVGSLPILGLDVWEHAYYLKYNNRRPEYIKNWWSVVNWNFVSKLYDIATS
eukprot:CAMPEP_0196651908 /NCGR_PEP_ID=MMETSP1086-20130531/1098_1 /TAXON_ID=77921 /ORGANISM="Cyanoptyche  gloeocystis , Strain SAG4.97" /LENGTH=256 /DNA_ID=CAMNT_0041982209 /DNA_START=49 /DNA_END=819 /DNA_ORIENTATION=+